MKNQRSDQPRPVQPCLVANRHGAGRVPALVRPSGGGEHHESGDARPRSIGGRFVISVRQREVLLIAAASATEQGLARMLGVNFAHTAAVVVSRARAALRTSFLEGPARDALYPHPRLYL